MLLSRVFVRRMRTNWKWLTFLAFILVISLIVTIKDAVISQKFHAQMNERLSHQENILQTLMQERQKMRKDDYPVNYSVLSDPYYVLQQRKGYVSQLECLPVDLEFGQFNICPVVKHDVNLQKFLKKEWFVLEIENLVRCIQAIPNAGYIDMGANIGIFTLSIMASMNFKLKTVAVEANPNNIRALLAGLEANSVPTSNYAIIQRGIADTVDESLPFGQVDDNENTNGAINARRSGKFPFGGTASINVLTATVDSHILPVAKAMNITTAVVKLDIEGFECLAIKNAKRFFENIYVPYIIIEHFLAHANETCVVEMHQTLTSMNYYPFAAGFVGLGAFLQLKDYKDWGVPPSPNSARITDVIWKKII